MQNLVQKVKEYINDYRLTTIMSTVDKEGNINIAIVNTAIMADPNTIKVARVDDEKSYENLKAIKKAVLIVVVPTDAKTKGICIEVELIKDETEGEDFETMQAFVNEEFGGSKIKNLLTFNITEIKPVTVF